MYNKEIEYKIKIHDFRKNSQVKNICNRIGLPSFMEPLDMCLRLRLRIPASIPCRAILLVIFYFVRL